MILWYAYVRHSMREAYEALGWRWSADLGPTHGTYSILMEAVDEAWLPVEGWEDSYQVSLLGRVRSIDRIIDQRKYDGEIYKRRMNGRILSPHDDRDGYLSVSLRRIGENKTCYIAHLVARAFIGPRPDGNDVCHNDNNRRNNAAYNLRYDTHKGNESDKLIHGTRQFGEKVGGSRLTEVDVRKIRKMSVTTDYKVIAKQFGISVGNVNLIINRSIWSHLEPITGEAGTPEGDIIRAETISKWRSNRMRQMNIRKWSNPSSNEPCARGEGEPITPATTDGERA